MSIKLVDSLSPMGSFPVAEAKDIVFDDSKSLQEKYDLGELGGEGGGHVELTQAEYDALSEEEKLNGVTYFITDAIGGGDGASIDDNTISTETTWSSAKIVSEMSDNYAIFEGIIGDSYYSTVIGEEDIANVPVTDLYGGWTLDKVTTNITEGSILSAYNNAKNKKIISFTEDVKIVEVYSDSFSVMDDTMNKGGEPYKVAFLWSDNTITEPCFLSVGLDIDSNTGKYYVMRSGGSFEKVKYAYENNQICILNVRFNADAGTTNHYITPLYRTESEVKFLFTGFSDHPDMAITLKDPKIWSVEEIEQDVKTYTSLDQLGLTADATIQDVMDALPIGGNAIIRTDSFTNWSTLFNGIQWGYLKIEKTVNGMCLIELTEVLGDCRIYYGKQGSGKFVEWQQLNSNEILHTSLSGNLAGITTVLDLVNALLTEYRALNPKKPVRFISGEITKTTLTDFPVTYGVLQITVAGWDVVEVRLAHSANGFKSMYYGFLTRISGEESISSITWEQVITENKKGSKALVTNAQNFKIDLTKNNASWYGMFTFNFTYGSTLCEITVTIIDKVYYTITKGQNVVSAITYTQNGANYQIGIDFTAKMYGIQVVDMPSEFGTINSLTAETFAGATAAILKGYGIRTYTKLSELGLTADATLDDVIATMTGGQSAAISTTEFTNYQTLFPYSEEQDAYATVNIEKSFDSSRTIVEWVRKDASKVAYGGLSSNNKVTWWNEYATKSYVDSKVVTPVLKAAAGANINSIGTPTVTASTSGNETTFTFNNLKGAVGATPTIKASAGSNINAVGTPAVSASTSGTTTTFTFNYLKGAKGDKGDTGVTKSTNGPNYTVCTVQPGQAAILFCVKDGGGYLKSSLADGNVYINGTAITSSNQQSTTIDVGKVYAVTNQSSSNSATISTYSNGGGQFIVLGPV